MHMYILINANPLSEIAEMEKCGPRHRNNNVLRRRMAPSMLSADGAIDVTQQTCLLSHADSKSKFHEHPISTFHTQPIFSVYINVYVHMSNI